MKAETTSETVKRIIETMPFEAVELLRHRLAVDIYLKYHPEDQSNWARAMNIAIRHFPLPETNKS